MESRTPETALLVMDMQNGITARFPDSAKLAEPIKEAIAYARPRQIPVIYVVVGFRSGMPEISSNNKSFTASKKTLTDVNLEQWMGIIPSLAPAAQDIVVVKRRISAFTGSDLAVVLSGLGVRHLVLTGIATSGVVLSTLREAADRDFRLTVLSDCCLDADEEVHRVLTTKVFPRQAEVLTVKEWISLPN